MKWMLYNVVEKFPALYLTENLLYIMKQRLQKVDGSTVMKLFSDTIGVLYHDDDLAKVS